MFYPRSTVHQALSQQARHQLKLLLGLLNFWVQMEDFLKVTAGRQVVLEKRKTNIPNI